MNLTAEPPNREDGAEIADALWNPGFEQNNGEIAADRYYQSVLEQYKLAVEMADRISERRGRTNEFFLTLNTLLAPILAAVLSRHPVAGGWLLLPLAALVTQSVVWAALLRSYRLLNSRKFRIIGVLEERLPARVWRTEWGTLGKGSGIARFWRFTLLERYVPLAFAAMYLMAFCAYVGT